MHNRQLIAGVALAVAVGGAVLFVKLRHQPAAAGNGPEVHLDISAKDGHMLLGDIAVNVAVEPRPAQPFQELRFVFRFNRDNTPVAVTDALVSFNMTMDMGPHDYRLVQDGDQWLANNVVLPKCGSGSRLWFGDLEFSTGDVSHTARFRIDLAPES